MAQNAATLRLMSDLREMQKDAPEGASAAPMNEDNIFVWTATIFGPADTPWEGGIFSLRMTFCDQYPDKPPKVCGVNFIAAVDCCLEDCTYLCNLTFRFDSIFFLNALLCRLRFDSPQKFFTQMVRFLLVLHVGHGYSGLY